MHEGSDTGIQLLASCPWGPVTANGVDLLTEIHVIYTMPIAPAATAGEAKTYGRKARKYIMMRPMTWGVLKAYAFFTSYGLLF